MFRSLAIATILTAPALLMAADWQSDYAQAFENSKKNDRPIFVHFTDSSSQPNWKDRFADIGDLADRFELVVADKATPEGSELFRTFDVHGDRGSVVVERSRKWQYFRADRELSKDEVTKVLTECQSATGKPARSVLTSTSRQVEEMSPTSVGTGFARPAGYCPNCQRFR